MKAADHFQAVHASVAGDDWRSPLLNAASRLSALMGVVWFAAFLISTPLMRTKPETAIIGLSIAMVCWAALHSRASEWLRLAALVQLFTVPVAISYMLAPPNPGTGGLLALAVLLCTLYLGRRAGLVAVGLVFALCIGTGIGWDRHLFPLRTAIEVAPTNAIAYWIRVGIGQVLGTAGVVAAALYVVEHSRRALRELHRSEQFLRTIIAATNDGIWDWDMTTGSVTWSNRVYEILQAKPNSFGMTFEDVKALVHPDDLQGFESQLATHRMSQLPFEFEVRLRRGDGSYGFFRSRGRTIHRNDGTPVRMVGTISDETERRTILEDRKLAEDALQRSEERFRSAMLNSAIGMALADPDGQCFEVNPALCAIIGYTREELLRVSFPSITHPSDRAADSYHFQRMINGEVDTYEMEKRYVRKDGSLVWVQLNVSLVRDASGRPLHSISQIQDITERRTIAATREEILERLRLALKTGHLGTFRRNLRTGEGQWDEQSFALIGRDPSAGMPTVTEFLAMVHAEDRERVRGSMESVVTLQQEVFCAFRLLQTDGTLRHFHSHFMIEPALEGRREWITGVFSDVSAVVEAQESLKIAAQRLQLALSTSKLGVWQYDLQTSEIRWDERMYEIYQRDPTSLPLSDVAFLEQIVPEDREGVEQAWKNMLAGGPDYRIHYRITSPSGDLRHIDAHGVIQFDDQDRARSVIGVNSDVTDLINATAEYERLREQLQQAQKMETLGTLAAGVAHDFNNLLTGIKGFVDLAASSLPPGHEARDLLKQALRGAMNARDLVRRILDFSRGRGDQARTRVDLGELVRDSAPLISAALPSNISLSVFVDEPVVPILGDSGQLQQVLMNLCINGSHAMGTGSGTLQITVRPQVFEPKGSLSLPQNCEPGSYVCLSVSDSGCGMDAATRERIFEPFFTTKREGVGTGLGLSIVRDIVTSHLGGIVVETTISVGTTFSVYLPAMVAANQAPAIAPPNVAIHGAGQRILVVDDDPAVAMVLRLSLQKSGFSPEVYTSSIDAWKRFARAPKDFDLLMVDQNMPDLNGRDFILQVRRVADIPIIIMSGRFERSELSSDVETPDVYEIKKPFEVVDLISAVVHSLHRTHPATTNEPNPL